MKWNFLLFQSGENEDASPIQNGLEWREWTSINVMSHAPKKYSLKSFAFAIPISACATQYIPSQIVLKSKKVYIQSQNINGAWLWNLLTTKYSENLRAQNQDLKMIFIPDRRRKSSISSSRVKKGEDKRGGMGIQEPRIQCTRSQIPRRNIRNHTSGAKAQWNSEMLL